MGLEKGVVVHVWCLYSPRRRNVESILTPPQQEESGASFQ